MIEHYYSNDWLIPLGEKAKDILKDYPKEKAVAAASVVYVREGLGQPDVPWAVVFDSDNLDESLDRLERTLKIPMGISPENDEEISEGVLMLRRLIGEAGANSYATAAHASMHMLKVVHGDPEEEFRTYQDLARFYPQYAGSWLEDLTDQFGDDLKDTLKRDHSSFFAFQELDNLNSQRFNAQVLRNSNERTADYVRRALETAGVVGIEEMAKILNRRLMPYQEAAHKVRGIDLPDHNNS